MRSLSLLRVVLVIGVSAAGCADAPPPEARESPVSPPVARAAAVLETEMGEATYYADVLEHERTASGELLDQEAMVAAHRRYPFGTVLRVVNLDNDRSVRVRIIDRGPFGAPRDGVQRVIDLSRAAAERLGFLEQGSARVRVEVLEYGEGIPASS